MKMWYAVITIPNLPLIIFILGVIYGLIHPGREDRLGMLKKSIGIGLLLGLIFGLLLALFLPGIFSIFAVGMSVIAFTMFVLTIAIPFIIGTLFGDLIERLIR